MEETKMTELRSEDTNDANTGSGVDRSRFHTFNSKGNPVGVVDMEVCRYLMEIVPLFVVDRIPYIYAHGVYEADLHGGRLKEMIQSCLYLELIKSPTVNRIYDLLIGQNALIKEFDDLNCYPKDWINFKNGMLDVRNDIFYQHDPKYFSTNQIPYDYDVSYLETSDDAGFRMKQFMDESLPDPEDQIMFWQYFGVCMTRDTSFQKFLMLKGPGGTGKSVLIGIMEAIIGPRNCSSISIQDLNKRFYATGLWGKLLNACADIPSEAMRNTNVLKKAVGEDMLMYERKGGDPTIFRSYAKLVFSANEMPLNLDDKTNAYYRRLLVLEMKHTVQEEERNPQMKEKLLEEWKYIIYKCVNALQGLYQAGHFSISKNSERCVDELNRASDSVKAFLDDKIQEAKGRRITRSEMYRAYESYCSENDRNPVGRTTFYKLLLERGFMLKRDAVTNYYYKDVDFITEDFHIPDDWGKEVPFA